MRKIRINFLRYLEKAQSNINIITDYKMLNKFSKIFLGIIVIAICIFILYQLYFMILYIRHFSKFIEENYEKTMV